MAVIVDNGCGLIMCGNLVSKLHELVSVLEDLSLTLNEIHHDLESLQWEMATRLETDVPPIQRPPRSQSRAKPVVKFELPR